MKPTPMGDLHGPVKLSNKDSNCHLVILPLSHAHCGPALMSDSLSAVRETAMVIVSN